MGNLNTSHKGKNNFHKSKNPTRLIALLLIGSLFFLYIISNNIYNKKLSNEPTLTSGTNINFVSTGTNPIVASLTITQTKAVTIVPSPTTTPSIYYVSPDGNDINSGSINQPWKTISYAVTKLYRGSSLFIRGGVYQEKITITNSGTLTKPILITNFENEEVIIDGNKNTLPSIDKGTPLVSIVGDWIIFNNITVRYAGDLGVYANGNNVTLDNLYVHHNRGSGVVIAGDYSLIQNSRIWYNSTKNENGKSITGWGSGVSCARYPNYCTIRKTVAWENWGEGISTFEALNTTIEGNISYDNQQNFYISDTKYSTIQGNLSYCTSDNVIDSYETQNGILVGDEKGVPIPLEHGGKRYISSDNSIINNIVIGCNHNLAVGTNQCTNNLFAFNTFVNSYGSTNEQYNIMFFKGKATNVRFENNIIIQDDDREIAYSAGSGILFSNNLWSKDPPQNVVGSGDIVGDPLLSKQGLPYSPEWFMPTNSSPARNMALFLPEVTIDYFGNLRKRIPDIGAIEIINPYYETDSFPH
jgi:hypothetical protein